jgi:2-amino-4-hydroxy-6-hydroxymethyldihydropteridine diphosphokinase
MAAAYVSIGSNLEPRLAHLMLAARELAGPGVALKGMSGVYETEPVGVTDQPAFLNTLAALETDLSPEELLHRLQAIEAKAGKKVAYRWGPRTLDLDLVLQGSEVRDSPELTLPHPRMHQRAFVLIPLCEIAPEARHPLLGKTALEMLAELPKPQPKVQKVGTAQLLTGG